MTTIRKGGGVFLAKNWENIPTIIKAKEQIFLIFTIANDIAIGNDIKCCNHSSIIKLNN